MKENKPIFPLSDQALCLRREIRMRYGVYPGQVASQKITQDQMDREIGLMEAAADTVEKMAKNGLFRESWNVLATARPLAPADLMAQIEQVQKRAVELVAAGELPAAYQESVKLAGLTLRLAEIMAELQDRPGAAAAPAPAPRLSPAAAVAAVAPPASERASGEQKQEIMRLLNNPAITRAQKTKTLLNLNMMRPEAAENTIRTLSAQIAEHEGPVHYRQAS